MDTLLIAIAVAGAFLAAGTVKGVIGLGQPPVALALMTLTIGLPQAMALLIVPSLATNLWQATRGGHARAILSRHWLFFATAAGTVWLGVALLDRVDPALPAVLLSGLLVVYGAAGLGGFRPRVPDRHLRWAGVPVGVINGITTGMTAFALPGVFWLQSSGLSRDALIQAMGILFAVLTLALAVSLGDHGRLTPGLALGSVAAVVPSFIGMAIGRCWRDALPEATFRRLFNIALVVLGGTVLIRTLAGGS
jgi:uncharacterized membrane protein YfcA